MDYLIAVYEQPTQLNTSICLDSNYTLDFHLKTKYLHLNLTIETAKSPFPSDKLEWIYLFCVENNFVAVQNKRT